MAPLFLLVLAAVSVFAVSNASYQEQEEMKGVTLTLVFDTTSSMSNELEEVKKGTQDIFEAMYENPDKPIYNYVLVPFNDPEVGPVTVTTDPVKFNNILKAITVSGGGEDCPEMALTGLKLGVEESLPGSDIYLISDASAKDYNLQPEVEALVQRKHTQVSFILTGTCSGKKDPGYQVYESIAATSGGQVFNVNKGEVSAVLDYIRDSIQAKFKVALISVDKREAERTTFIIPVDETMDVFTISVSGQDPSITIKDPHGVEVPGVKILDLPGGLVIKVPKPERGNWTLSTSSSSGHRVRVTSVSEFDFSYGFSAFQTDKMAETSPRPLGGAETSLLVRVRNQTQVSRLTKVQIKDIYGNIVRELSLSAVPGQFDLYRVDKFIPPTEPFYLEVCGEDKGGNPISRISRTTVTPQVPECLRLNITSYQEQEEMKGVTLTFVFDTTSSMSNELEEVKKGTQDIFEAMYENPDKPIYNYVLVPFNDPEVGPVTVTTDPVKFINILKAITVSGGGLDCPEMALTGLKLGVEESLPGSDIYLISDATAKDYNLQPEVEALVQRKHTQVSFILTGTCSGKEDPGYQVYESIAATSGGQVFNVNKGEVSAVLDYIKDSIQAKFKVALISVDKREAERTTFIIPVDETMDVFTISVSGQDPSITIKDPHGVEVPGVKILDLPGGLVIKVPKPERGNWTLSTSSSSGHRVRVTSVSEIDFSYGFSAFQTDKMAETSPRPLGGAETSLLVRVRNQTQVSRLTKVQIKDIYGNIVRELSLSAVPGQFDLYRVDKFIPPTEPFYLEVCGEDKGGNPISRISRTTVTPQVPECLRLNIISYQEQEEMKGVTLTLVFDTTSSMSNELEEVKKGTQDIFEAMYENPDKPIYNYVLVPFNDPEVGPVTVTTDPVKFNNILKAITVSGGGEDCPEMALTGLKLGVEESLPGSDIYLISDASAKDYNLQPEVEALVQRKHTQVSFILTGTCSGKKDPGYQVYESIAATSGGQVFNVNKGEVRAVLDYIRDSIQAKFKVALISVDKREAERTTFIIPVDETMDVFTISVSGQDPSITIKDPHGVEVPGVKILDLPGGLVIKVPKPERGNWTLSTSSSSGHRVRVTSVSEFDFSYGFSAFQTDKMAATSPRPLGGAETSLLVRVRNQTQVSRLTKVQIKDIYGNIVRELSLSAVPGQFDLYRVDKFIPPTEPFYLEVCGEDKGGNPISRISRTTVTPQVPGIPVLDRSGDSSITKVVGEFQELACEVLQAYPPPIIKWFKDGELVDERVENVKVYDNGSLIIPYVTAKNEGNYECEVSNTGGAAKKMVKIAVLEPPILSGAKQRLVKAHPGKDVKLTCSAQGNPKPVIIWKKDNAEITPSKHIKQNQDGSLQIKKVTGMDNGTYQCIASNSAGVREKIISLLVQEPPKIAPGKEKVSAVMNRSITLECNVAAYPPSEVKWLKNGVPLPPDHFISNQDNSISFIATPSDAGQYECIATNIAGEDKSVTNVVVLVPPVFESPEKEVVANQGQDITLVCSADSVPPAEYFWYSGSQNVLEGDTHSSTLILHDVKPTSAGEYICQATNSAGSSQKVFNLKVNDIPKINSHIPEREDILQGADYEMQCSADGSAKITWKKDGKPLPGDSHILKIKDATHDDSALYTCTAVNKYGTDYKSLVLNVLVPPVMEEKTCVTEVEDGAESLLISCPAIEAYPPPTISWYKDGQYIDTRTRPSRAVSKDGDRSLEIKRITEDDHGQYTCLASNVAGHSTADITVKILTKPMFMIRRPQLFRDEVEGASVTLDCSISGYPPPQVTWYRNGHHLLDFMVKGLIRLSKNQILQIPSVKMSDVGEYQCVAENKVGRAERKFSLAVHELGSTWNGSRVPQWTDWSPWSSCSSSCGKSEMVRIRKCSDESASCSGSHEEWKRCIKPECQVDGGWNNWSPWSDCTATCGIGQRKRYRKCYNPPPSQGGKSCEGNKEQYESCNMFPCPIGGSWSEWSQWESCNGPCYNSTRRRIRRCTEPSPAFGGDYCEGPWAQYESCRHSDCPVSGQWSAWSPWSSCSASCGPSIRKRFRTCNHPGSQFGGHCDGDDVQVQKCPTGACDNIPLQASVSLQGLLNGQTLSDTIPDIDVLDFDSQRTVQVSTMDVLKQQLGWFPYLQYFVSPLVWITAFQKDGVSNGHTLTQGHFRQIMQILFDSGEKLVLKATCHGTGSDNKIHLHVTVDGEVPLLPLKATTNIEPYEEDYVQTGPGEIFATSSGTVEADGDLTGYKWNKTITYNQGKMMPYLVQTLTVKRIENEFNPSTQRMTHKISAMIGKKAGTDPCPDGYLFQPDVPFCQDKDECAEPRLNNCHITQSCENHSGSYYCACPPGLKAAGIGAPCLDIDECSVSPDLCSHYCANTEGGFKCLCPPGLVLLDDNVTCSDLYNRNVRGSGHLDQFFIGSNSCPPGFIEKDGVCQEINPCKDSPITCSDDEICIKVRGWYRCLSAPCPQGYTRDPATKNCVMFCSEQDSNCDSGAKLTQTVKYMVLTPEATCIPAYWNITSLPVWEEDDEIQPQTSCRIKENDDDEGKPFRVKMDKGEGILYSNKLLPSGKDYRVVVETQTYDDSQQEILKSTKYIILIRPSEDIISL